MSPFAVVLVTTSSREEAEKIAEALLQAKLVACCNIVSNVSSLYWWQGKIEKSAEVLMLIKTRQDRFPEISKTVKSLHSYSVPEIIMLPIIAGDDAYTAWIESSLK